MRYGYKASAEQFGTRELLEFSLAAERSGLDTIAVSDHFQPWRHNGGHAPAAMTWLGALAATAQGARLGHERADADHALPPVDRRPVVRDPGAAGDAGRCSWASGPARR